MRLRLAGDRAALKTAFQPLLRQFRQGLLGLAHQYLLVKLGRLGGVVVAIELDVAKQQRHESPPAQNRSLSFWILRLIHQLFQQPAGQAMGLGVVAQAVGSRRSGTAAGNRRPRAESGCSSCIADQLSRGEALP